MSLKTRLRVSIVALVTILVVVQSLLSLRGTAAANFQDALERSESIGQQVRSLLLDRLNEQTALATPPPTSLEESKALWESYLEEDQSIAGLLEKLMANTNVALEIQVCGETGRVLTSSSPARQRLTFQSLPDFTEWNQGPLLSRLIEVLSRRKEYALVVPLGVPSQEQPIFTIQVIVSSVLMRNALMPQIRSLALTSLLTLLASVLVAVLFSNAMLRPLERVSRRIDLISEGMYNPEGVPPSGESTEIAAVQSKLNLLSEQFRGAKQDVVQMRSHIEHMLRGLDEAVLMFGADNRLVLAGEPAERLLGRPHAEMIGLHMEELFFSSTPLGAAVQSAVELQRSFRDHPVLLERDGAPPRRLLLNIEPLESVPGMHGTLVTLRDVESRRQVESQLDISTRLAAINRLTGGVAHEIKNPLNAMALHLEILRSKLKEPSHVHTELDVISREIARLDRVVKTFLDFTRPVELQMREVDLIALVRDVASLVSPQARQQNVQIDFQTALDEAPFHADRDLVKQAILNVVVNGIESMKNGGSLRLRIERLPEEYMVSIADEGAGIPPELRDRIFHLYFTTKDKGSGFGLAMTFRVIQLHNATIDFKSETGKGTTFRLRFPAPTESALAEAGPQTPTGVAKTVSNA